MIESVIAKSLKDLFGKSFTGGKIPFVTEDFGVVKAVPIRNATTKTFDYFPIKANSCKTLEECESYLSDYAIIKPNHCGICYFEIKEKPKLQKPLSSCFKNSVFSYRLKLRLVWVVDLRKLNLPEGCCSIRDIVEQMFLRSVRKYGKKNIVIACDDVPKMTFKEAVHISQLRVGMQLGGSVSKSNSSTCVVEGSCVLSDIKELNIENVDFEYDHMNIFGKYQYKTFKHLSCYPYDFGAIDITVSYNRSCNPENPTELEEYLTCKDEEEWDNC